MRASTDARDAARISRYCRARESLRAGAILTPIYQSTTFVQASIDEYLAKGYSYSRTTNPTVRCLEEKIAALEGGVGAVCFSTGMAATTTVMSAFLKQGDHCIVTDCSCVALSLSSLPRLLFSLRRGRGRGGVACGARRAARRGCAPTTRE